ncbi:High mobility group protein B3 [Sarcoptes scabiei]|uniref:High mobility group protein B3 n=1 Tax=Sarcoptes scabiei TaxID=52283 RepID=A0A132AJ44_SARSC|nr:High mobility group protein B3 [Sarcoptes scabiei]KPM10937.1 High mobility group protein B3-like protein [Sarcoptes scabiei]UXI21261.1 hypothetical protein NH340_JMT07204 [Sarcoptes scabiei]
MSEYADYHQAMAHHAATLNANQLHPATMTQIPMSQMISATGLNLTVMPGQLTTNNAGQHQLAHGQIVYTATNVQPTVAVANTMVQQQHQQHHHHGHKKIKKPKVNKDGVPAPKRAATPFINFTQWYREELKKGGRPIPKIAEFGKECAAKWAQMSEDDKKPFLEAAAKDRDRYKREMAVYKPARDASKPKRPGTAFMLFMVDFRKEMAGKEPEGGVAALAKLGGERWRNMTEDEKRPYVERQNQERVRYESSMEDYRRKGQQALAAQANQQQERREGSNEESDSDSIQQAQVAAQQAQAVAAQQVQQAQQQQIHLTTPSSTTAYLLTGTGAVYSQIQAPYSWN